MNEKIRAFVIDNCLLGRAPLRVTSRLLGQVNPGQLMGDHGLTALSLSAEQLHEALGRLPFKTRQALIARKAFLALKDTPPVAQPQPTNSPLLSSLNWDVLDSLLQFKEGSLSDKLSADEKQCLLDQIIFLQYQSMLITPKPKGISQRLWDNPDLIETLQSEIRYRLTKVSPEHGNIVLNLPPVSLNEMDSQLNALTHQDFKQAAFELFYIYNNVAAIFQGILENRLARINYSQRALDLTSSNTLTKKPKNLSSSVLLTSPTDEERRSIIEALSVAIPIIYEDLCNNPVWDDPFDQSFTFDNYLALFLRHFEENILASSSNKSTSIFFDLSDCPIDLSTEKNINLTLFTKMIRHLIEEVMAERIAFNSLRQILRDSNARLGGKRKKPARSPFAGPLYLRQLLLPLANEEAHVYHDAPRLYLNRICHGYKKFLSTIKNNFKSASIGCTPENVYPTNNKAKFDRSDAALVFEALIHDVPVVTANDDMVFQIVFDDFYRFCLFRNAKIFIPTIHFDSVDKLARLIPLRPLIPSNEKENGITQGLNIHSHTPTRTLAPSPEAAHTQQTENEFENFKAFFDRSRDVIKPLKHKHAPRFPIPESPNRNSTL